jgi:hypothetical protein
MHYAKDTNCPFPLPTGGHCQVVGSPGGIKRHLKATHHVHWSEFPDLSNPRKLDKLSTYPTEALLKELGKRLGVASG